MQWRRFLKIGKLFSIAQIERKLSFSSFSSYSALSKKLDIHPYQNCYSDYKEYGEVIDALVFDKTFKRVKYV